MDVQHAIGEQKVSVTVTRKTHEDKVVSQHSAERWFRAEEEAVEADRRLEDVAQCGHDHLLNRREPAVDSP